MDTSPGASTIVSADSLRAAALSTLKAKRRKPVSERPPPPLPSRPLPPSDSFALDYGQDEQAQDTSAQVGITPKLGVQEEKEKPAPVVEDVQMREEGEISEEDEPPPPSPPKQLPKQPPTRPRQLTRSPRPTPPALSEARRPLEVRLSPPIQPKLSTPETRLPAPVPALALVDRVSSAPERVQPKQEPMDISLDGLVLEDQASLPSLVGPNRVRPGLEITQEEYDIIKDIIIDLLGWGVPFDYLVDCGVSREVIFYVFNELNLRLPDSFNLSGIIPYTPETFAKSQQSSFVAPPIPDQQRQESLEPTVSVVVEALLKNTPSTPAPVISTPSAESPSTADLHDMERQRRQELMARKAAVQASRKMKQSLSVNSSVDTPGERNSISAIATETVEDFLKSLAPVQTKETPTAVILSRKPEEQLPAMDVDQKQVTAQPIPQQQYQKQDPIPVSAVPEQFSVSSVRSYSAEPPPTSVVSSTTSFPQLFESAPGTPPIFSSIVTRRGLKRPVASDFVDVDPAPKRHEHSINSIRIQPVLRPMLSMTRRPPSNSGFSNIGSRRCVIDLSDSEDEDEGIREEIPQQPSEDQLKQPKAAAYPSPTPMKPAATSPMSPEVLMQKEMEIRKMRELIAQREEETRLRRLALAKSTSASASAAANATGTSRSSTPVVQNVVSDVRMASPSPEAGEANGFTTQGSRSSESATPPPSTEPSARTRALSSIENDTVLAGFNENLAMDEDFKSLQDILMSHDKTMAQSERSVDVDQNPSPSTQMKRLSTLPVLPKQDERKSEITSAANDNNDHRAFEFYQSLFESYPLLLSQTRSMDLSSHFHDMSSQSLSHMYPFMRPSLSSDSPHVYTEPSSSYSSSTSSAGIALPNLQPLKVAALAKVLNPTQRLCQYEVPGGGTCRDDGCRDVHLNRLEGEMGAAEPSDEDTADYLFNILPQRWLQQRHVTSSFRIFSSLQQVRQQNLNNPLRLEERVTQVLDSFGPPPT